MLKVGDKVVVDWVDEDDIEQGIEVGAVGVILDIVVPGGLVEVDIDGYPIQRTMFENQLVKK